jgi:CubicO group peptidase (beta-lactamase class C family)
MGTRLEAHWDRLGEFVARLMAQKAIPGVAMGILHDGDVATAGFGVTNVEHPLPVTDETLFQIGSITKTFTGTAIMRLVERGKLELDATVRTYVPDFQVMDEAASSQATIRHLLTHTSGWAGDFFHNTGAGDDALSRYVADMRDLPQLAPIGTLWSYNNAGFSLAGEVMQAVTGKSYEAALKQLVLEPLDLKSCYFDAGDVMTYRFAVGHDAGEEGPEVARPWPLVRSAFAAGGIACHVQDLLRYARFHLGDGQAEGGTRLLTPDSMAQIRSPQATVWGSEAWGLAWRIEQVQGARQLSHSGGTNGQVSLLVVIPEHDFALAILTNASQGGHLTEQVRRWALKEVLGLEVLKPEPIQSSPDELARYAGRYWGFFNDVETAVLGGKLVGQVTLKRSFPSEETPLRPAPPPMSLGLLEKDRLLVLNGDSKDGKVDVLRRPDGSIGWVRFGGRLHTKQA